MKRVAVFLLMGTLAISLLTGCGNTTSSSVEDSADKSSSVLTEMPKESEESEEVETIAASEEIEVSADTDSSSVSKSSSSSSSSYSSGKTKVKCSMCNGTGSVKYYYGSSALEAAVAGHNDYEYGPCSSCDGTGYTYVKNSGSSGSSSSSKKVCPSCGKSVSSLSTRKDAAGVSRTWCSSCWSSYNSIMGN